MPYINSTKFGQIVVDNEKYGQVLIVGDSVIERESEKLKKVFGTSHKIGDWEIDALLKNNPDIVVIGTGQSGVMKVGDDFLNKMEKEGVNVFSGITPRAIKKYNEEMEKGKSVNALIHTTC
ncbi:MAG: hypothetical protein GF387_03530 [Candidatus Portnoybacteria bacterium]|nr:hypothetical protein [Candidatus Portnoybacteria bacterium]